MASVNLSGVGTIDNAVSLNIGNEISFVTRNGVRVNVELPKSSSQVYYIVNMEDKDHANIEEVSFSGEFKPKGKVDKSGIETLPTVYIHILGNLGRLNMDFSTGSRLMMLCGGENINVFGENTVEGCAIANKISKGNL